VSKYMIRRWSPAKTEECPIEDFIYGGYCESDEQLRARIKLIPKEKP
jgi:hypothetical protein